MEKELVDNTDFGTYLGELGRQALLRGEILVEFGNSWQQGAFEESSQIIRQLGVEISQIGQQLELIRNQLCQSCALKSVKKRVLFGD